MSEDLLDLYERASGWTAEKVRGATTQLDAPTPCEDWNVRTLLSHMLETQRYFAASGRGEDTAPPSPTPSELHSLDPVEDFEAGRTEVLAVFTDPVVRQKTGPALGIAFSDQLLHGWDLARATGQETTMPEGCAEAAYDAIYGRFTEDQRKGIFKPEITVPDDASPQARLLAYTGRPPDLTATSDAT